MTAVLAWVNDWPASAASLKCAARSDVASWRHLDAEVAMDIGKELAVIYLEPIELATGGEALDPVGAPAATGGAREGDEALEPVPAS